jgi:hypothetical protein
VDLRGLPPRVPNISKHESCKVQTISNNVKLSDQHHSLNHSFFLVFLVFFHLVFGVCVRIIDTVSEEQILIKIRAAAHV